MPKLVKSFQVPRLSQDVINSIEAKAAELGCSNAKVVTLAMSALSQLGTGRVTNQNRRTRSWIVGQLEKVKSTLKRHRPVSSNTFDQLAKIQSKLRELRMTDEVGPDYYSAEDDTDAIMFHVAKLCSNSEATKAINSIDHLVSSIESMVSRRR